MKLVSASMRKEHLNRHEEMSFMQDSEANEKILKDTICKDELCRFLTPLKFLQINTWREVATGEKTELSDQEKYRKWRTPVEILLVSNNNSAEDDGKGREKRLHERVKKQNEEILMRMSTSHPRNRRRLMEKSRFVIRPRTRQIMSASDAHRDVQQDHHRKLQKETSFPSYSPDKFATVDQRASPTKFHASQSSMNPLSRNSLMTSYFMPKMSTSPPLLRHNRIEQKSKSMPSLMSSNNQKNEKQSNSLGSIGHKVRNQQSKSKTDENNNVVVDKPNNRLSDGSDVQVFPYFDVRTNDTKVKNKRPFTSASHHKSKEALNKQVSESKSLERVKHGKRPGTSTVATVNYGSSNAIDNGMCMPSLQPRQKVMKKPSFEKPSQVQVIRHINYTDKDSHSLPRGKLSNGKQRQIVGQTNDKRSMLGSNTHKLTEIYKNPYSSLDALDRVPLAHYGGKSYYIMKPTGSKTVTFRLSTTRSIAT